MEPKTMRCLFLGYDSTSKMYRLYNHTKRKIILSCDIMVDESKIGFHHLGQTEEPVTFLPTDNLPSDPIVPSDLSFESPQLNNYLNIPALDDNIQSNTRISDHDSQSIP